MATWVEDIVQALKNLGGQAHRKQILEEVKRIRKEPLPVSIAEVISRTIQDHSSDSNGFRGNDLFRKIGNGVWALREQGAVVTLIQAPQSISSNKVKNELTTTWIEDIVKALENLGGQATLNEIYTEVKRIRVGPLPATWKATISGRIQAHSSDSNSFKGKDLFQKIGKGTWGLRQIETTSTLIFTTSHEARVTQENKGRKFMEDNGLFLGKEIFQFSIEEPAETITTLIKTIKQYREYTKVDDISEWFDYVHQIFHIFGFSTKEVSKRLITIHNMGENQQPKALVCIVGPDENFNQIAYEVTWESYLYFAAKYYQLEWVILTNGLQFKIFNTSGDIDKYFKCEFDEIIKDDLSDSFFAIYKIFHIISSNKKLKTKNVEAIAQKAGIVSKRKIVDRHVDRKEFWTQLIEKSKDKTTLFRNKTPGIENYFGVKTGIRGVSYSCNITYDQSRIEIYIDNGNYDWNKEFFDYLFEKKQEIEQKLGYSLIWDRLPDKRASVIRYYVISKGLQNKDDWDEIQDAFIDYLIRTEEVFKPLIKAFQKK